MNRCEIIDHDGRPALVTDVEPDGTRRLRVFATTPGQVDEYVTIPGAPPTPAEAVGPVGDVSAYVAQLATQAPAPAGQPTAPTPAAAPPWPPQFTRS